MPISKLLSVCKKGSFWGFHFHSKTGDPRYLISIRNRSQLVSSNEIGKLRTKRLPPLSEVDVDCRTPYHRVRFPADDNDWICKQEAQYEAMFAQ
jgi:hypothetical protein